MLYLIPTPISDQDVISEAIREAVRSCDYFVVENVRTARRFISSLKMGMVIDELEFVELSEHTLREDISGILRPIKEGRSAALMSEAGLPCVADPGSLLVDAAHRAGVRVVPFVGASSIMLALMSSGASGQNFAFNGYLPVKSAERVKALRRYEQRAIQEGQTQIFIETPYRNLSLMGDMLGSLRGETRVTVACNLTGGDDEFIMSRSVREWKGEFSGGRLSVINKKPTIFIIWVP